MESSFSPGSLGRLQPSLSGEVLRADATVLSLDIPARRAVDTRADRASRGAPRPRSERIDRFVNVALAGLAVLLLSPLLIAIAVAIKLTSRGPIFYMQTRVGVDRRSRRTALPYDKRG